jgi:hypothetical protein
VLDHLGPRHGRTLAGDLVEELVAEGGPELGTEGLEASRVGPGDGRGLVGGVGGAQDQGRVLVVPEVDQQLDQVPQGGPLEDPVARALPGWPPSAPCSPTAPSRPPGRPLG